MSNEPCIAVTIDRKINLGNYESASVGLVLSGVPVGATVEEINAMLDTGRIMYDQMRARIQEQVVERRRQGGAA
jgi:hypothetical protein